VAWLAPTLSPATPGKPKPPTRTFLTLSKDANPNVPILKEAKVECASRSDGMLDARLHSALGSVQFLPFSDPRFKPNFGADFVPLIFTGTSVPAPCF